MWGIIIIGLSGVVAVIGIVKDNRATGESSGPFGLNTLGLTLLLLAVGGFSVGIAKEISDSRASARNQRQLQDNFDKTSHELDQTKKDLERAVRQSTADIPRQVDYPLLSATGAAREVVMSVHGGQLMVMPGDTIKFTVPPPSMDANLHLSIGDFEYPLRAENGRGDFVVAGTPGIRLPVYLLNAQGVSFQAKLVVESIHPPEEGERPPHGPDRQPIMAN